jgi:protein dithiol oxidoreductase (disulfide-forming)
VSAKRPAAPARRRLLQAAAAGALIYGLPAGAQQPRARPNLEYFDIAPQPIPPGPRIEVIELFWYGCPYCYELEPFLDGWLTRKPADVHFRRMPALFRQSWVPHTRLFHVLASLGELDRLHGAVYKAIHEEGEKLADAETAAAWASRNGIGRDRFIAAYNAPAMDKMVEQSIADTRRYQIKGTPSLVVDGRYVTSTGMSESISGVIGILDDLVRLARERRAKA